MDDNAEDDNAATHPGRRSTNMRAIALNAEVHEPGR